ncbi:MAG: ECF RNA polymerase sigma factor SigW [Firmicutes bacterium ADurb.Bin248]|jgi:RNA polymerase sigma-70 factor (ECF subfamily)|nr:MAG: ECF RNA polymerase sigma factor SigW [Firmicutes bacterium ADurb.Bin248]HOG01037.1 RNA polymerase sigma factor [Clostridia bacterium]HPK17062.1 RNA polymerase sigma factor [Clostridia bacterium]
MDTIERLYDDHFKAVYWAAYGIMHSSEGAEDAAQSVFMKALRHRALLSGLSDNQAKAWLYKATRNECIDSLRKLKPEYLADAPFQETADEESLLPENMALRKEQSESVFRAIDLLPEKYRAPIFLYYFAELPQREIAITLGVNESTLRSILRRGKSMLHKALTEGGLFGE